MIRVTIEILPGGDATRRRVIGWVDIANVSGLADVSDYTVSGHQAGSERLGVPERSFVGVVAGHRRSDGVFDLVSRALAQAEGAADAQR